MKYKVVQEYYIDPDSIELEDFCNICQYVQKNMTMPSELVDYILSLMTTDHIVNLEDTQFVIAYLPQKYNRYKYVAEIREVSPDGGKGWFRVQPIVIELSLLSTNVKDLNVPSMPLATLTINKDEMVCRLYKGDFDRIFQEIKDNNEETFDSDDGNSGIGEELNS